MFTTSGSKRCLGLVLGVMKSNNNRSLKYSKNKMSFVSLISRTVAAIFTYTVKNVYKLQFIKKQESPIYLCLRLKGNSWRISKTFRRMMKCTHDRSNGKKIRHVKIWNQFYKKFSFLLCLFTVKLKVNS